ncbi:hypothetical protein CPAV1605_1414 [seawater metagenome]|uniref:Uncharacterized protein n=1 Tax=seawater metagenome TaxID=1561972 RepID=A0A5E8CKB4_9ZZZZ
MSYRLDIILNDYSFSTHFDLDRIQMKIYNIERAHPILSILWKDNLNVISFSLYYLNNLILQEERIIFTKELYEIYKIGNKNLFCHCLEFDKFVISIDIMSYFGMKYFKSIFIYRKSS